MADVDRITLNGKVPKHATVTQNLFKQRTTVENLTKGKQVWLKTSRN
jgi:hypothetical protein